MPNKFTVRFFKTDNFLDSDGQERRLSKIIASLLPRDTTLKQWSGGWPFEDEIAVFLSNNKDFEIPENIALAFSEMLKKNPRAIMLHVYGFESRKRYNTDFESRNYHGFQAHQIQGSMGRNQEIKERIRELIKPLLSSFVDDPTPYKRHFVNTNSKGSQTDYGNHEIGVQTDGVEHIDLTPTQPVIDTPEIYTPGSEAHNIAQREEEYKDTQEILRRHAARVEMVEQQKARITREAQERYGNLISVDSETQTDEQSHSTEPEITVINESHSAETSLSGVEVKVLEKSIVAVESTEDKEGQRQLARALLLLETYILTKREQHSGEYRYGMFSRFFGNKKSEYVSVAIKLIDHYTGGDVNFTKKDINILSNGDLHDVYKKIQKDCDHLDKLKMNQYKRKF